MNNKCPKCSSEKRRAINIKDIIITDVKSIDLYKENEFIMKMTPRKEHN